MPLPDLSRLVGLVATSEVAATFDVIVPGLDPARPTQFMDFVDPRRGEPRGDGTIRAPRLGPEEVFARYGSTGPDPHSK